VDASRRHLHLTNKPTLVKSKLPIVTSYEQLDPGVVVHAFIVSVKESGFVICFHCEVHIGSAFDTEVTKRKVSGMRSHVTTHVLIRSNAVCIREYHLFPCLAHHCDGATSQLLFLTRVRN